jgi:hypothetical protein
MEDEMDGKVRVSSVLPIECPLGCVFVLFCWFASVEEIPEEILWFCLGKGKDDPLKDVPIGVWACRPDMNEELEFGNS